MMRAKEYLELNKKGIYYYETVKKSIYELYPLRRNKVKTEKYFNRYLFAEARHRRLTGCYNGEQLDKPITLRPNEVSHLIAPNVRNEILNVIADDETFIYAYNIIVLEKNCYTGNHRSNVCKAKQISCDTIFEIEEKCRLYKEDYPKSNLADYLIDDENRYFLEQNKIDLNRDEKWWLDAFNKAYEIFDEVRVQLFNPFEAKNIILNYTNDDKDLQQAIIGIINHLVAKYFYDLTTEQQKKIKILSSIIEENYSKKYGCISYKEKAKILEEENKRLEKELNEYKMDNQQKKGMTTAQQVDVFYYLFNALNVNYDNSVKSEWEKFIHTVTGKNKQNIKTRMEIEFENSNTKRDLLIVADLFRKLFPEITRRILRDCGYSSENMPPEEFKFEIEDL